MDTSNDLNYPLSNWLLLSICFILLINSCTESTGESTGVMEALDYSIDTSGVPNDTIDFEDVRVSLVNGIYFFEDKTYSGILFKVLKGYNVKTYSSIFKGKLHGTYRSFFQNGKPYEVRQYKNNLAFGRHYGYWEETGHLKFEYNYYDQKKEGTQRNWYANGDPYYEYNYKDDKLDGLQRAWRTNGSLYRNFEVKNGIRYGLQKSAQCYELTAEEIK